MSKESSNGAVSKQPPTPSPLRNSKFFQSNMRILVTGGAGFIGSHLVDRLMENEKNEVIVADNYFTGSKDNLKKWIGHPRFELIRHDITEPLLIEVDKIYHLACPASPIFYKYNAVKTIKTNVIGTLNMLGLAKRVGARILLTSTSEVYGDPLVHPQTEEYWGNVNPIGVRSCYDEGKRVAETLMFDYHRQHGIEVFVCKERSRGVGECLLMIKGARTSKHTWKIDNLLDEKRFKQRHLESEAFMAGNHEWKIELYPNGHGEGNGNSVSMFLALADSSRHSVGRKLLVDFTLSLMDRNLKKQQASVVHEQNIF